MDIGTKMKITKLSEQQMAEVASATKRLVTLYLMCLNGELKNFDGSPAEGIWTDLIFKKPETFNDINCIWVGEGH